MTIDLKTALAQRRKAAESALRINVCLDRDLVDEFEDAQAERARIIAPYEKQRNQLAARAGQAGDLRMGESPADLSREIDAEQAKATVDIDAKIAEIQERGSENTVQLIFAVLPPARYQEIVNRHLVDGQIDPVAFTAELVATAYRGVEQAHEPLEATWDEISDALNFGEVDAIGQQVLMANRGTVAAPFSRKSSALSR